MEPDFDLLGSLKFHLAQVHAIIEILFEVRPPFILSEDRFIPAHCILCVSSFPNPDSANFRTVFPPSLEFLVPRFRLFCSFLLV